jgi:2,3-bisphosphoglycerate-independent phosphoglycerate mutase
MKLVVIQADGMADEPIEELSGKTPLEAARTPNLDLMASRGILGLTRTIPRGLAPETDVGAMSVLGYDPARYHTGRSPLEAAAKGLQLGPTDVAIRLELVALEPQADGTEVLRALPPLTPEEAGALEADLARALSREGLEVRATTGSHLLAVWRGGEWRVRTTPPHALIDRSIAGALPEGSGAEVLRELITASRAVLAEHPACTARRARGEAWPRAVWPWGQGRRPALPSLRERFGVEGAVVTRCDVVRGLGALAGLHVVDIPDALETDLAGDVEATVQALGDRDFVLIHLKGADASAHRGDASEKVAAIERLDEQLVGPLLARLRAMGGDWRVLAMPDHATPCGLRRHTDDPVPFVVYVTRDEDKPRAQNRQYHERDAREKGIFIPEGHTLMERLTRR